MKGNIEFRDFLRRQSEKDRVRFLFSCIFVPRFISKIDTLVDANKREMVLTSKHFFETILFGSFVLFYLRKTFHNGNFFKIPVEFYNMQKLYVFSIPRVLLIYIRNEILHHKSKLSGM